jgi:hypothetical protein
MIIFDIGPQPPVPPVKPQVLIDAPKLPPGAHGDPRIEPETRRHAEACRAYERAMGSHKAERTAWERESGGGAVELSCNSVSGGEMLERGRGRYVTSLPSDVKLSRRIVHSY